MKWKWNDERKKGNFIDSERATFSSSVLDISI
jgi:hypothetical protein